MTKHVFIFLVLVVAVALAGWALFSRSQESVGDRAALITTPTPEETMDEQTQQVGGDEVTLEGGLKVQDMVVGEGQEARAGDTVAVHYTGWLTDGTKFDSSVDRGQPFVFPLGQGRVIRGWDVGVQGMKVGGKRKLTIPSDLAYGEEGAGGGAIPPGATLVFEVELLDIQQNN
jgi:FKBP-type peptidyl-prolyl cis-trans isomerase